MPAAGRADAGRSRSDRRDVLLRAGRAQGHGRRRLGGRLEAPPLRLGIQGPARRPERGLRAAPPVLARAREPASLDRLRHGAVPDPHQLDEQRQPDARVRARRPGRRGDPRPAQVAAVESRSAAAGGDPAVAHRARGVLIRSGGAGVCAGAVTTRRRSRTSSTGSSSACLPTTSACCRTTCSRGCLRHAQTAPAQFSELAGELSG